MKLVPDIKKSSTGIDAYTNKQDKLMILIKGSDLLCNQLFNRFNRLYDMAVKDAIVPILNLNQVFH